MFLFPFFLLHPLCDWTMVRNPHAGDQDSDSGGPQRRPGSSGGSNRWMDGWVCGWVDGWKQTLTTRRPRLVSKCARCLSPVARLGTFSLSLFSRGPLSRHGSTEIEACTCVLLYVQYMWLPKSRHHIHNRAAANDNPSYVCGFLFFLFFSCYKVSFLLLLLLLFVYQFRSMADAAHSTDRSPEQSRERRRRGDGI